MEQLQSALETIRAQHDGQIDVAMVLGSGLGSYAETLENATAVPYASIPGMPGSSVSGHAGNLVLGTKAKLRVVAMQGRVHLYEGHSAHEVVFGVRLMARLGATTMIVTNAAGGVSESLVPGDLMAITDQLNLTGTSSLLGPNNDAIGPRFVDMTAAFDAALIEKTAGAARGANCELKRGVYAGLLGPAYETPAEVRMLRTLGADAVGMSTVLEVLAARHLGVSVLGLSCITNVAAGLSDRPLSHDDVKETAHAAKSRFVALLDGVLDRL